MNKSKSRKVGKLNKKDRISRMPDSVLCHILSFLPTEAAVRTSILSSRWKFVWTSLPNLMFNDKLCYRRSGTSENDKLTRFENFVDRMLLSNSVSINKFSLHCRKLRYLSRLKFWVALAIMRNVREIEVNLRVGDPFEEGYEPVELPDCIYNSETLEILKLESDFVFKSPSSGICFPRVKKFHVEIHKPNMPDFSICPVLEDLSIVAYLLDIHWDADISISSQTLKRLNLIIEGPMFAATGHQATIEAPKLESLHVKDDTLVSYLVYELHSLCDACIDIYYTCVRNDPDRADRALQLLKKLTNLKSLYLSHGIICALGKAYRHLYDAHQYSLPTFSNLSFLEVRIREYGWWILPIIFNCSPNLESFVLIMDVNDPERYEEAGWIEPQFVPYCLQFNVKKIEILYGDDDPLEPVKYVGKSSNELCKELLMFPRGSKTCEVEFRGK
ncbi:F-box/FBD/LRR-repeat protein [Citrus sinensis]|uniref:F-box/FBD/LRR-repeat protein n=1 Tax=Citrus sinensis TaxID=2711 RepID=A0ACB8M9E5_CITSI|nr:F-box/FBD/LRR-repeat protein [Citrus sinensis]